MLPNEAVLRNGSDSQARYVHEYDEEYEEVKKTRRPGRPASTREDLLRMKIEALSKEQKDGFCKVLSSNHLGRQADPDSRHARSHHREERPDARKVGG